MDDRQADQSGNYTSHITCSQVFIKSEPGSTSSLLSVDSPVLLKNSPKQFIIGKAIEKSINEDLIDNVTQNKPEFSRTTLKTEPSESVVETSSFNHNTRKDCVLQGEQIPDQNDYHISKEPFEQNYDYDNQSDDYNENDIEAKKRQIIENETTVYRCQECENVFRKYPEYKMHRTEHSIEKRTCKICHILFQGITKLNEHMNVHKGIRPFKCSKCKKSFISAHTLKCHMECHRTENSFRCETCGKGFKTKRSLRGHMDTHAKKIKEYICKICKEEFDFPTEYRRHLTKHGAEPPQPKCSICEKVFKYESQLKTHLGSHKELKFPCEYCSKIFSTMTKIRKHVKRTHILNECEFCKKVFYDKAEFARHKKTEHVEEKPSICKYCNKGYDKLKNLQEHIRVQHTEDGLKNKCEICDKTFINRFLLNNHVKTHDKCFKCPSCNMQFSSRYNLQLHSVTHTNEKKYKCTLCFKAYSSKVSLQTHVSTHSEERPYSCSQCGKTFKNNRRLYVHKKSHETELKFECYTCGNKFKTKEYLKAHLYKHYKVKPFDCPHCSKQFKHKKTLDKHVDSKHLRINRGKRKNSGITESSRVKKEKFENITNQEEFDHVGEFGGEHLLNLDVRIKMELNEFKSNNIKNDGGEMQETVKGNINEKKRKINGQRCEIVNVKVEVNDE